MDSVRIVLFDKNDNSYFLVLSEIDDPDNFKLPGGKFENNETPDVAANRELNEELGINEPILEKAAVLVNDDAVSKRFIYFGMINRDEMSPSEEIADTKWVTQESIPEGKNLGHIISAIEVCKQFLT